VGGEQNYPPTQQQHKKMKMETTSALYRQQIVILLLMTCLSLALTAPTTSLPSFVSEAMKNPEKELKGQEPIIATEKPSTKSSFTSTSGNLDTITNDDNEMMRTRLFLTTTAPATAKPDENLIGVRTEVTTTTRYDNGTIKIHERVESPSSTSQQHLSSTITIETNVDHKGKSINSDVTTVSSSIDTVATTNIEKPIKMEEEKVFVDAKKGKFKDGKKKAMAADKKQKLKQKLFSDAINHPTIVPTTNEPTTDKATEVHETATHETAISTSIKTAPTTIKSTTLLTTIKSFQLKSDSEDTTTESMLNTNDMEATSAMPTANRRHNDNVIVLNSNTSGLIVIDVMENFGAENASTETFEIKMDLIDDPTLTTTESTQRNKVLDEIEKILKDEIFITTIETPSTTVEKISKSDAAATTTTNDDIILINVNTEAVTSEASSQIKWNQVKNVDSGNIKITFDNIDLPNQNVNVSIENGELVIDSIDISVLNKAEEELKKKNLTSVSKGERKLNKTDSLEIILIEDDSHQDEKKEINRDNLGENDESNLATMKTTTSLTPSENSTMVNDGEERRNNENNGEEFHATTLHFDVPSVKHDHLPKIEMNGGGEGDEEEDGIKIKTTDKDSDTIFYMSNTEVKVIESIPTTSPNASHEKKYYPAIYEEDVILDVPKNNNRSSSQSLSSADKYEEDIVLSPLTSDFDPKDINYIGEAFLDVEESSNNVAISESHHIIPLTSDVVIQPVQLRDSPPIGIPIIGELPPQIELEEMVFSDDYDSGKQQQSGFHVEEYYPNFLGNRLVKNQLEADVPKELIFDSRNVTLLPSNRTHISINTMINGTNVNMTSEPNPLANATAYLVENDADNENSGEFSIN
jgi:hypothetical protein